MKMFVYWSVPYRLWFNSDGFLKNAPRSVCPERNGGTCHRHFGGNGAGQEPKPACKQRQPSWAKVDGSRGTSGGFQADEALLGNSAQAKAQQSNCVIPTPHKPAIQYPGWNHPRPAVILRYGKRFATELEGTLTSGAWSRSHRRRSRWP